jgi:hypothetical protein
VLHPVVAASPEQRLFTNDVCDTVFDTVYAALYPQGGGSSTRLSYLSDRSSGYSDSNNNTNTNNSASHSSLHALASLNAASAAAAAAAAVNGGGGSAGATSSSSGAGGSPPLHSVIPQGYGHLFGGGGMLTHESLIAAGPSVSKAVFSCCDAIVSAAFGC